MISRREWRRFPAGFRCNRGTRHTGSSRSSFRLVAELARCLARKNLLDLLEGTHREGALSLLGGAVVFGDSPQLLSLSLTLSVSLYLSRCLSLGHVNLVSLTLPQKNRFSFVIWHLHVRITQYTHAHICRYTTRSHSLPHAHSPRILSAAKTIAFKKNYDHRSR